MSRLRGGAYGFYGLAHDYITFENMRIVHGPPSGNVVQENLKYVNTDLASFLGAELYSEFDWTDWLTPYATLSYVQAEDLTRNGDFATKQASPGSPSVRVDGLPRGYFSGVSGGGKRTVAANRAVGKPSGIEISCARQAAAMGSGYRPADRGGAESRSK